MCETSWPSFPRLWSSTKLQHRQESHRLEQADTKGRGAPLVNFARVASVLCVCSLLCLLGTVSALYSVCCTMAALNYGSSAWWAGSALWRRCAMAAAYYGSPTMTAPYYGRRGLLCLLSMSALPDQNWLCFVIC